jgi:5-formyltetrahydrofolate cyclo-ligase
MTAQAGSAALSSPMSPFSERERIRREIRARRRALSAKARAHAAIDFATAASNARLLRPHLRIAFYIPHEGEADPRELIRRARLLHCDVFLPIITSYRQSRMRFAPCAPSETLVPNRYGIPEPVRAKTRTIPVRRLDVIVLPLIAVDPRGWRLGSGAGYYDRCLRHLRIPRRWRRPKLIGLAYEFQRISHLTPQPWDVPVDAVLTEKKLYRSLFNDA